MKHTKIIASALLAIFAGQAAAQSCGWTVSNLIPTPRPAFDLVRDGDLLFALIGESFVDEAEELVVYDVSSRFHPVEVGRLDLPCSGIAVAADNGFAYVAYWCREGSDSGCEPLGVLDGGLWTIDVSDPTAPSIEGCLSAQSVTTDLVASHPYVYYPNFQDGRLGVVRVSDPADPRLIRFRPYDGATYNSISQGNGFLALTIAANGVNSLRIFDLASPGTPERAAFIGLPDFPRAALAHADSVVVALDDEFIRYDVSDLSSPIRLPNANALGQHLSTGTFGYNGRFGVQASGREIVIRSVADGDAPTTILESTGAYAVASAVGVSYVSTAEGIAVIPTDIATLAPVTPGRVTLGTTTPTGVASVNNVTIVTDQSGIIRAFEYAGTTPRFAGDIPSIGVARAVDGNDEAFFLASSLGLIQAVTFTDDNLATVGTIGLGGVPNDIEALESTVLAVSETPSGGGVLEIFDVSDATNMTARGSTTFPSAPRAVALSGQTAYVSTDKFVFTIDLSDVDSPIVLSQIPLAGVQALSADGRRVAAARGADGLTMIDTLDPNAPIVGGTVMLSGPVNDVDLDGTIAHAAVEDAGFVVIDATDLTDPNAFFTLRAPSGAQLDTLALSNDIVFAPADTGFLFAFDTSSCSVPCSPVDVAPPFGTLDLVDLDTFIFAWTTNDPAADLAAPQGVRDLADVDAFISAFLAGCP